MVLGLVSSADGIPQFRVLPSAQLDTSYHDLTRNLYCMGVFNSLLGECEAEFTGAVAIKKFYELPG